MDSNQDPDLADFTRQGTAKKANPYARSEPHFLDSILAQLYDLFHKGADAADPYTVGPNFGLPKSQPTAGLTPTPMPTQQPTAMPSPTAGATPGQDQGLAQLTQMMGRK